MQQDHKAIMHGLAFSLHFPCIFRSLQENVRLLLCESFFFLGLMSCAIEQNKEAHMLTVQAG